MDAKKVVLGVVLYRMFGRGKPRRRKTGAGPVTTPKEPSRAEEVAPARARHAEEATKREHGWRGIWGLLRDTFKDWSDDNAPRLGAALSYYTVFALAPLLIIIISVAGLVLGTDAAQGRIIHELTGLLGSESAKMLQTMLAKSSEKSSGIIGTVVGSVTLLVGATAVMVELEAALDAVWRVKPKPGRGVLGAIRDRLLSLGLVLTIGFLMIVSLAASALLGAVGERLDQFFEGASVIGTVLTTSVSFLVIGAFFALIFKFLPKAKVAWRDVWVGAAVTSALFHVGKVAIGLYLGRASVSSTIGAAGSLAITLVLVYYTAQIVLLGAEFTRIYADRYGSTISPNREAVSLIPQCTSEPTPRTA
jgi:membrane protein